MCNTTAKPLNIDDIASLSGLSASMVRECESFGLLAPGSTRSGAGQSQYTSGDVHTLQFVRRGFALGFSMSEVAKLIQLWRNKRRASADVKRIALEHAEELDRQIEELEAIKRSLQRLSSCCHGDQRPDCPIIDELAELTGFARCGALITTRGSGFDPSFERTYT